MDGAKIEIGNTVVDDMDVPYAVRGVLDDEVFWLQHKYHGWFSTHRLDEDGPLTVTCSWTSHP